MDAPIILAVCALHVGFFLLESVFWMRKSVRKLFGNRTVAIAASKRILALNQGFYNLGVAMLLAYLRFTLAPKYSGGDQAVDALLLFIVAMGIVGGVTATKSILLLQAAPAAAAVALRWS